MRASLVLVASLPLVLGTGAAATAAARPHGDGPGHGHRHGHAQTITVVERAVTDTTTDTGARGDSVGDMLTFANPIFDRGNRHRIGRDNGYCVRTRVTARAAYECSWTTTLRGGSLVVSGPFYDTGDSVLAITGGTGRFADARGQMRLHARNAAASAYDFTYRIVR